MAFKPAAVLGVVVTASTGAANAQLAATNKQLQRMGLTAQRSSKKTAGAMAAVNKAAKVGGLALAAAGGFAIKTASDFESAFANVEKTVDATEQEYDRLAEGIRNMSKEIPTSSDDLAELAGVAGQLGIEKDAILGFTRTVADLGETTNLQGEDAAKTLARIGNIMGTDQKHYDRMGSTIVELGNNLATTESEITEMSLRLAGAGRQVGLTESEVLAFAGTLSSVGVQAQAGGTAISRAFIEIANSVEEGGERLDGFAEVAGVSSEKFAKRFEDDAAGAMTMFIEGLGEMRQEGDDVFGTLDELGLGTIRVRDALLRSSGAGDLLRRSLKLGSDEWKRNNALTEEANTRYETTAARFQVIKNRVRDWFVEMGNNLLPAVGALFDFLENPKPLRDFARFINRNRVAVMLLGGVVGTMTAAWLAYNTAVRIAAGGQALFNLIMSQNPLVRVITLLSTLAAGIVVAYNESETFRRKVDAVWRALRIAARWVVNAARNVEERFVGAFRDAKGVVEDVADALGDVVGFIDDLIDKIPSIPDFPDIDIPLIGGGPDISDKGAPISGVDQFTPIASGFGLQMTSGFRPGDLDSWHGRNRARDYAGSTGAMLAFARFMAQNFGPRLLELIHTPLGFSIDNGQVTAPFAQASHFDHVHVAMAKGGKLLRDSLALVGERGPEIAALPGGTRVIPNRETRSILAPPSSAQPAAAPVVYVNARVFVGDREITDIARVEAETVVDAERAHQAQLDRQIGSATKRAERIPNRAGR